MARTKKTTKVVKGVEEEVASLEEEVASLAEKHAEDVVEVVKKPKVKRAPSAYNLFVKDKMQDPAVKALPPKERMGAIGQMWKAQKAS